MSNHSPFVTPACDQFIAEALGHDHPVLLVARQSADHTRKTCLAVATELRDAATALRDRLGIDIVSALPDVDVLAQSLFHHCDVIQSQDEDGESFNNHVLILDLRPVAPVVLILSSGSAAKLDTDGQQPFVLRLASLTRELRPSLVFANRLDRLFRVGWEQAPFQTAIEAIERRHQHTVRVADARDGLWDRGIFGQANALLKGKDANTDARTIVTKSRRGMVNKTGTDLQMTDGRVRYHLLGGIPPGFIRVTMGPGSHDNGAKYLYLDDPGDPTNPANPPLWPAPLTIQGNLPCVTDGDGLAVSQVENVRWLLAHAGAPGWTSLSKLATGLVERRYSTDSYRERHGAAAAPDTPNPHHVRTILGNLDLYETGTLTKKCAGAVLTFTNLTPTDGRGWATPEDFARIRAWMSDGRRITEARASYTFSGLEVKSDHGNFVLRSGMSAYRATTGPHAGRDINYNLMRPWATQTQGVKPPRRSRGVTVRHRWLAESIVEALIEATSVPAMPVQAVLQDSQLVALRHELSDARRKLASTTTQIASCLELAEQTIAGTDEYILTERRRKAKYVQADELENSVNLLQQNIVQAQHRLAKHESRLEQLNRGIAITQLVDLVLSLRDPHQTTYRELWRDSIHNFTLTTTQVGTRHHVGTEVAWTLDLHLSDEHGTVIIPVRGRRIIGGYAAFEDRALDVVAQLRAGRLLAGASSVVLDLMPRVAEHLGTTPQHSVHLNCEDPALMRLLMAVLHPHDGAESKDYRWTLDDPEWEATFGRPDLLAAHIDRLRTRRGGRWWQNSQTRTVEAHVHAALHEGHLTSEAYGSQTYGSQAYSNIRTALLRRSRWVNWWSQNGPSTITMQPCSYCGSHNLAPMRILEVQGQLCLDCRHDRPGVTWPAADFDRYVDSPELWTAAGRTLDISRPPMKRGRGHGRELVTLPKLYQPRRLHTLPQSLVDQLVREYHDELTSLRTVALRHQVLWSDLRDEAASRGILRKRGRLAHRSRRAAADTEASTSTSPGDTPDGSDTPTIPAAS